VKLKIVASLIFLSAIFPEKLFYQTSIKIDSTLPVKLFLEPNPTKVDSLVKLSYTKQAHTIRTIP
jgi:hypothetical protein